MRIADVHLQPDYSLSILADNGRLGRFDVSSYLQFEAFEDFRRLCEFAKVFNGGYRVEWACGADLSTDTIEDRWQVVAEEERELAQV